VHLSCWPGLTYYQGAALDHGSCAFVKTAGQLRIQGFLVPGPETRHEMEADDGRKL
jgi:hypothetical protein